MKTSRFFMLFLALWVCTSAEGDVDFVDTDSDEDTEVALKCDACRIVASKFVEAFADIQGNINPTVSPKDEEIIEAAEGTCDDTWEGGDGTFAACSTDNWGPWPGDDYEDYDDAAEFEDIHDEF
ncbi:putative marginal zone B- and B1-cell-specific protein-like, partial [Homarus americanus]